MKKRLALITLCAALTVLAIPTPDAFADHPNLGIRVVVAIPAGISAAQLVFLSEVIGTASVFDFNVCDYVSPGQGYPCSVPIQNVVVMRQAWGTGPGATKVNAVLLTPCCAGLERGTVIVHLSGLFDGFINSQPYSVWDGYVLNQ